MLHFHDRFLVRVSYLEIYNEEVRDLLGKDQNQRLEVCIGFFSAVKSTYMYNKKSNNKPHLYNALFEQIFKATLQV